MYFMFLRSEVSASTHRQVLQRSIKWAGTKHNGILMFIYITEYVKCVSFLVSQNQNLVLRYIRKELTCMPNCCFPRMLKNWSIMLPCTSLIRNWKEERRRETCHKRAYTPMSEVKKCVRALSDGNRTPLFVPDPPAPPLIWKKTCYPESLKQDITTVR